MSTDSCETIKLTCVVHNYVKDTRDLYIYIEPIKMFFQTFLLHNAVLYIFEHKANFAIRSLSHIIVAKNLTIF